MSMLARAVLGVAIIGCASTSPHVNSDFDSDTNFSRYKTYSWNDDRPVPDQLTDRRIVDAIDRQLQAKGLTKVDSASGDLVVSYRAKVDTSYTGRTTVTSTDAGWPGWGGMRNASAYTSYDQIRTGSVVVAISDMQKKQLVWRGFASAEIHRDMTPEDRTKIIDDAMQQLFAQYPPEPEPEPGGTVG